MGADRGKQWLATKKQAEEMAGERQEEEDELLG